jgi:hypothetical protein
LWLCSVLDDIHVEDFELGGIGPWQVADIHDDLVTLVDKADRLLSAVQGWLEDGNVRKKIAILRDSSGRSPAEAATAAKMADRLERKLNARLGA